MSRPKVLLYDIECSNLDANFGICFCIGYKFLADKKVRIVSIRDNITSFKEDPTMDKEVIKSFSTIYNSADIAVGHYSTRFDRKFLNSKCLQHHLPPLARIPEVDTWKISYDNFKFNSNRLATISNFLETESEKNTYYF